MAVTVPPSTTQLIALADLKAVLGITDGANDARLGHIIRRGRDAIARFCTRAFAQRTVIETLPGPGGQLLTLKMSPVVTLAAIALGGETVDSDTYTLTEPDAGIVFREAGWSYTGHKYSYTATYTHGYPLPDMAGSDTLPHDIQ
jgi:hypothetical protein